MCVANMIIYHSRLVAEDALSKWGKIALVQLCGTLVTTDTSATSEPELRDTSAAHVRRPRIVRLRFLVAISMAVWAPLSAPLARGLDPWRTSARTASIRL
jgi:hypothetical protein